MDDKKYLIKMDTSRKPTALEVDQMSELNKTREDKGWDHKPISATYSELEEIIAQQAERIAELEAALSLVHKELKARAQDANLLVGTACWFKICDALPPTDRGNTDDRKYSSRGT